MRPPITRNCWANLQATCGAQLEPAQMRTSFTFSSKAAPNWKNNWLDFVRNSPIQGHCGFRGRSIRDVALPLGFVDTKVCAVDETWSGLKLMIRRTSRKSETTSENATS